MARELVRFRAACVLSCLHALVNCGSVGMSHESNRMKAPAVESVVFTVTPRVSTGLLVAQGLSLPWGGSPSSSTQLHTASFLDL